MIEYFVTETTFEIRKDGTTVLYVQRNSDEYQALVNFLGQEREMVHGHLKINNSGHPCQQPKPG